MSAPDALDVIADTLAEDEGRPTVHRHYNGAEAVLDALTEAGYVVTRWLPIPGFPGYEVSDQGEVRSHLLSSPQYRKPHLSHGYAQVSLRRDGGHVSRRVHALVMLAFVGPKPSGAEIRHLDGNPTNNRLSNLAYGTSRENKFDTVAHGNHHNAVKDRCPNGHPYTPENTLIRTKRSGTEYRTCRTCKNAQARARYAAAAHAEAVSDE